MEYGKYPGTRKAVNIGPLTEGGLILFLSTKKLKGWGLRSFNEI
jgi:hypothetical protein